MTAWTRAHCTCVEVRNLTYAQAAEALALENGDRWLRDNISRLPHQKYGQNPAVFCHCDLRLIQAMKTVMPDDARQLLAPPAETTPAEAPARSLAAIRPAQGRRRATAQV